MISDTALIDLVKTQNDSGALIELVERHTGIYMNMVQKYQNSDKINISDIRDERHYNIYQWALKYDSTKKMKFGTYVGEMTQYMCKNYLSGKPSNESIDGSEDFFASNDSSIHDKVDKKMIIENVDSVVKDMDDKVFQEIYQLRFHPTGVKTWREIGKIMGISHEHVRKIFNKNITKVKKKIKNKNV